MLESLSRPHFFPGQLLDFRDFNRLSEQGNHAVSFLSQQLFSGGGVVLHGAKEFEVTVADSLTVLIQPGTAILPTGETLVLREPYALDLRKYRSKKAIQTFYIGICHETLAADPYTDPEDPSIKGFRTSKQVPHFEVSYKELGPHCLELFRIAMSPETTQLRHATDSEVWQQGDLAPQANQAIVDLRHRKRILPLTLSPLGFYELVLVRESLYRIEQSHRRLQKVFLIEDKFGCSAYLSLLHSEILNVPFQPLKAAFLVSEFSEKLALLLEAIERKCTCTQANFNRELHLSILGSLENVRVRKALPENLPFSFLIKLSNDLADLALYAEKRSSLINAVEEALLDLAGRAFGTPDQTSFAGHVFRRVDLVHSTGAAVEYQATHPQVRKLKTRYKNGDTVQRTGTFIRDGKIAFEFAVPNPELPVVVCLPQYIRRKGAQIEYRVNGKPLLSESCGESEGDNQWKNRGLVIAPEMLVPQGNRFSIRIEETDLDFGFFEAAIYQPINTQGEEL